MVLPAEKARAADTDDALVSTMTWLRAALDYLLAERKRQILLFTCQKREMDYLQGRKMSLLAQRLQIKSCYTIYNRSKGVCHA